MTQYRDFLGSVKTDTNGDEWKIGAVAGTAKYDRNGGNPMLLTMSFFRIPPIIPPMSFSCPFFALPHRA